MQADHFHYVVKVNDSLIIKYQACNENNREQLIESVKLLNNYQVIVFSSEWENYFFKNYKELSRQLCFIF